MKKSTYIPLLVYLTKKQKTFIRNVAFKRKIKQSALIREIIDAHYNLYAGVDAVKAEMHNQDLVDEPTLPGEDDFN